MFLFKIYFIYYAIIVVPFFFLPFIPLHPAHALPPTFPSFSSCPWVIHASSSASTFPILSLTSPLSIFYLSFMLLFPVPFPPFSPLSLPTDNPPCDLYFCESIPVLVVFLVHFCFCVFLGLVVDSCELVVILLFMVFDLLLFLR